MKQIFDLQPQPLPEGYLISGKIMPVNFQSRLSRHRCACAGTRYDQAADGGQLRNTMIGVRAAGLIAGMHGMPASDGPGYHFSVVFNERTRTWQDVYVCNCPGPRLPVAQQPARVYREAAAGRED